jgi:hypothetical protein
MINVKVLFCPVVIIPQDVQAEVYCMIIDDGYGIAVLRAELAEFVAWTRKYRKGETEEKVIELVGRYRCSGTYVHCDDELCYSECTITIKNRITCYLLRNWESGLLVDGVLVWLVLPVNEIDYRIGTLSQRLQNAERVEGASRIGGLVRPMSSRTGSEVTEPGPTSFFHKQHGSELYHVAVESSFLVLPYHI